MKKNVASQLISAQMIATADGSAVTTGTCNVAVEIDGAAGTGGTATHIANGKWEYAPIQADTNGDYLTFQFVLTNAINTTVQVYTTFPQTGDNYTRLGAPAGASVSADIADVPTVSELNARTLLAADYFDPTADTVANVTTVGSVTTKTGYTLAATTGLGNQSGTVGGIAGTIQTLDALDTAQDTQHGTTQTAITNLNDIAATDIVSAGAITTLAGAVVNVDLVDTTTTNTDMRGTDSAALASVCTETRLSELDAATGGKMANQVDVIQTDTTTDIPALIAALQTDLDTLTDAYGEPTGVPAASATLLTKVGYLYMALRNQVDVTATKKQFYNDGGTAEWEKDLSESAGTYTETEANVI